MTLGRINIDMGTRDFAVDENIKKGWVSGRIIDMKYLNFSVFAAWFFESNAWHDYSKECDQDFIGQETNRWRKQQTPNRSWGNGSIAV